MSLAQDYIIRLEETRSNEPRWWESFPGGMDAVRTVAGKWAYYQAHTNTRYPLTKQGFEAAGHQIAIDMGGKIPQQTVANLLGRLNDTAKWLELQDAKDPLLTWWRVGADAPIATYLVEKAPGDTAKAVATAVTDAGTITKKVITTAAQTVGDVGNAIIPTWLKWTLGATVAVVLLGAITMASHKVNQLKEAV